MLHTLVTIHPLIYWLLLLALLAVISRGWYFLGRSCQTVTIGQSDGSESEMKLLHMSFESIKFVFATHINSRESRRCALEESLGSSP
jgi:hypothetical protein